MSVTVTIEQVKALRNETGASIIDAKKALIAAEGDLEKAKEKLKELGLSVASKKSGRSANDGVLALLADKNFGIIIELNSETDFVARNEKFQNLANLILQEAYKEKIKTTEELLKLELANHITIENEIRNNIAVLKENLVLSRVVILEVRKQEDPLKNNINNVNIIAGYLHNKYSENLGKTGALVSLSSNSNDLQKLQEIGRKVAIHIVASSPLAVSPEDLDPQLIAEQKGKFAEEVIGKPENIIQRISEGKLLKYYKDIVLLEQPFIMDSDKTVGEFLTAEGKEIGADIKILEFKRVSLGGS